MKNLKEFLQNNGLKVGLRGRNSLASALNFGKDRTFAEQPREVSKIPGTCRSS